MAQISDGGRLSPLQNPTRKNRRAMAASQAPVAVTASTCSLETERGRHSFEIASYSALKGFPQGEFVRSATFAVGGSDWCVNYLPNGNTAGPGNESDGYYTDYSDDERERRLEEEENRDYISLYLEHMSGATVASALFDFRLVNPVTGLSSPEQSYSLVFDHLRTFWGTARFIKKSDMEASYVGDDRVVIECNVTVVLAWPVSKPKIGWEIPVPPSDMLDNLGNLLESGKRSDVAFKVKGEVFHAHKFVLAMRSPVFEAELYGPMKDKKRQSITVEELYGPMKDKKRQSITVEDMQPDAFEALLRFIYTDSLPAMEDLDLADNEDFVKHLLVAADRYGMERMKSILCKRLDIDNAATILAIADQHHCNNLRDACIGYISSFNRMDVVVASRGYQNLKRTCPTVVMDLWERASKSCRI